MTGVGQSATIEEDRTGSAAPSALRINTDVFTMLTETVGDGRADGVTIVAWFDCWRP